MNQKDTPWRAAIIQILSESDSAMRSSDIAEEISEKQLRKSVGATPALSVNATISESLNKYGAKSPFIRVGRGEYFLRKKIELSDTSQAEEENSTQSNERTSIIQAFGMFWQRGFVSWSLSPKLLGREQRDADLVDFTSQRGVYLLHDRRDVVYVGRSTDRPLGVRLYEHTQDRLNGRWDRFSWFGLHKVSAEGKLEEVDINPSVDTVIVTLEALFIEGLEPPLNRKRGDGMRAQEYLQVEDPEIENQRKRDLLMEVRSKIR